MSCSFYISWTSVGISDRPQNPFSKLWNPFTFPHVVANCSVYLFFYDSCRWPYSYSKSIIEIHNGSFCTVVFLVVFWFSKSSMFDMCGLMFFLELSLSFLESNAILTNLSFFTVITIGNTEQLLRLLYFFSNIRIEIVYLFLFQHSFVSDTVWV